MGEIRNTSGFVAEIDRLRGFIIVLVVVSHALLVSTDTKLGLALHSAVRGATWPFLFIAGFLFAHLRDRYTWASFSRSKLQNVIAPYVVVVSLLLIFGLSNPLLNKAPLQHYLLGFPAARPLWFVPMIVLFFAAFPFYRSLCKFPRTLLAVTAGSFVLAALAGRPFSEEGPLPNFLYFQSAWLFGMAWNVRRERFDAFVSRYQVLLIMALVAGINMGMGNSPFAQRGQIFMWAPFTALLMQAMRTETPLDPIWSWLATRSFGIFFLHGVVTDQMYFRMSHDHNAVAVVLFSIGLTFACGVLVDGVKRLAGKRSRLLVGA